MEKKYVLCEGCLMHFRVSKLPWPFKAFFRGEDGKMTEHCEGRGLDRDASWSRDCTGNREHPVYRSDDAD